MTIPQSTNTIKDDSTVEKSVKSHKSATSSFSAEDLSFWTQKISGSHPLRLHKDQSQVVGFNEVIEDKVAEFSKMNGESLLDLSKLSSSTGCPQSMILMAVYSLVLSRHAGEDGWLLGATIPGKGITMVPVRMSDESTLQDVAEDLSNELSESIQHNLDVGRILEADIPMEGSTPFQAVFAYHEDSSVSPDTCACEHYGAEMVLHAGSNHSGEHWLCLQYQSDLYTEEAIREILAQMSVVIEELTNKPKLNLSNVSLLTPYAIDLLPEVGEDLPDSWEGAPHHHLELDAQRTPNKVAISGYNNYKLTYDELNRLTNRLAHLLKSKGAKKGDVISIFAQRHVSLVVSILAIFKAGCAYSIIDCAYPAQRMFDMCDVANPVGLISLEVACDLPESFKKAVDNGETPIKFVIDLPNKVETLTQLKDQPETNLNIKVSADDAALIAFTSGSTGKPKGVVGRFGPLTHFTPWIKDEFELSSKDRMSLQSGLSHDPLQRDIFYSLHLGASIHVPHPDDILEPTRLANWFKSEEVSVANLTPAMGKILTQGGEEGSLPSLRLVFMVGEILSKKVVEDLYKVAPNVTIVNLYGSTETQRALSYFVLPRPGTDELDTMKDVVPVGKGQPGCQLLVVKRGASRDDLASDVDLCGLGEVGEIIIRSPHLSGGYKDNEEETEKKFLPNPHSSDRLYMTGDLGRYMHDGNVECLGRADDQVQIRGFRVELNEITANINTYPGIQDCITIVRKDMTPGGDNTVVSYIAIEDDVEDGKAFELDLKEYLKERIPEYMVPSAIVILDALPINPNGKINRKALPKPEVKSGTEYVAPRNDLEEQLCTIWSRELAIDKVGVNDHLFFDLGGHSIVATSLVLAIRREVEGAGDLPVQVLFKQPTVAQIAAAVQKLRAGESLIEEKKDNGQQLLDDSWLDDDIQPIEEDRQGITWYKRFQNPKHIFLTGSSGFLGSFLLQQLMENTSATVFAHIRAKSTPEGLERIKSTMADYSLWKQEYQERITPICGDLAKPLLGMDEETFDHLADTVDVIFHNGALVHWMYPYEKLRAPNVDGTREILRLAVKTKTKAVHHISTTAVLDSPHYDLEKAITEDTTLPEASGLRGGYPQSKYVAEKVVMEAMERNIPCAIYRCGYVSGHSTYGSWNCDRAFLCRMIKGSIQLGAYPDFPTDLDISPVDFIASFVVKTALTSQSIMKHRAYHLVNSHSFYWKQLFQTGIQLGYPVKQLPFDEWTELLMNSANQPGEGSDKKDTQREVNALYPLLSYFTQDFVKKMTDKRPPLDNSNAKEALQSHNMEFLDVGELTEAYYKYMLYHDFLAPPQNPTQLYSQRGFGSPPSPTHEVADSESTLSETSETSLESLNSDN